MSFIRPDLAERLVRWRETLVWASVLMIGLWLSYRGLSRHAPLTVVTGLVSSVTGALFLRGAMQRLRLSGLPPAPGVVVVDEGRVVLLGPHGGGIVDLEALVRVEVVPGPDPMWRLTSEDATVLDVPLAARGADRLVDALEALPGLALAAGFAALSDPSTGPRPIWCRTCGRMPGRVARLSDE